MRLRIGLPPEILPIFWGLLFIEGTFGAYLNIWPLWIEHLGASLTIVGFVLGSSGFIRLFVLAPSSAIAERFGYRHSIVASRACSVIALVVAGFATHWTQLIITIVAGAVGELVFPLTQSLVASMAGDQRMRSFALVFTVGPSIALTISPLISGVLVHFFGMRAAFFFAAACSLVSLYFLAQIHEPDGFARRSDTAPTSTSSYRAAISVPIIRMIAILLFATVFVLTLGTSFIPTFLEDVRGIDAAVILFMSAGAAVGSACFGLAVARIGRLQRSPFVVIALAITMTLLGFVIFRTTGALGYVAFGFFCRGGLFSAWAMHNAALGELAPAVHRTRAFALTEMVGGVAYALGPMVAGPLYSLNPTLTFDVAIVGGLILIPVMFRANRRSRAMHAAIPIEPESALAAL